MRNPWSAFLLPRPPPPATPGRARGPVWCPVLPPTVTIVTSSPQRNQKTVRIGELVNQIETSGSNPHFFFKVYSEESEWRPYWKVVILGKSWFSDSVFRLQLYFTDLRRLRRWHLVKEWFFYNSFITITMFLFSLFDRPLYFMCFVWHHCKEIQWQFEWTIASSMLCFTVSDKAM